MCEGGGGVCEGGGGGVCEGEGGVCEGGGGGVCEGGGGDGTKWCLFFVALPKGHEDDP